MKRISTVIVTYNGKKWIERCLLSLFSNTYKTNVIIIDNNSSDGTLELINFHFKDNQQLEIISLKKNIGFGQANNIGINQAIKENADYIFLLNQDTWVDKDVLEKLIDTHLINPQHGIISPLHMDGSGKKLDKPFSEYLSKYLVNTPKGDMAHLTKRKDNAPLQIHFINAAAWLISREAILKTGGFDALFFHWGEDRNFIDRMTYKGFSVGLCTNTKIYHDRVEALRDRSSFFKDYYFRSKLRDILNPNSKSNLSTVMLICLGNFIKEFATLNFGKSSNRLNAFFRLWKLKPLLKGKLEE